MQISADLRIDGTQIDRQFLVNRTRQTEDRLADLLKVKQHINRNDKRKHRVGQKGKHLGYQLRQDCRKIRQPALGIIQKRRNLLENPSDQNIRNIFIDFNILLIKPVQAGNHRIDQLGRLIINHRHDHHQNADQKHQHPQTD